MNKLSVKRGITALMILAFLFTSGTAFAGTYSSTISSIHSSFTRQNTYADNINQQICNGTYRTTELCEVIATILDR